MASTNPGPTRPLSWDLIPNAQRRGDSTLTWIWISQTLKEIQVRILSHTSCLLSPLSRLLPSFSLPQAPRSLPTCQRNHSFKASPPPASGLSLGCLPRPPRPLHGMASGCSGTQVSWAAGRAVRSCLSTQLRLLGRRARWERTRCWARWACALPDTLWQLDV